MVTPPIKVPVFTLEHPSKVPVLHLEFFQSQIKRWGQKAGCPGIEKTLIPCEKKNGVQKMHFTKWRSMWGLIYNRISQEISNGRTHGLRAPNKKPEYLIALSRNLLRALLFNFDGQKL